MHVHCKTLPRPAAELILYSMTACILLALAAHRLHAEPKQSTQQQARQLFIEVERISRADQAMQKQQLEHVYKDLVPKLYLSVDSYSSRIYRPVTLDRKTLSPDQMAAKLTAQAGWPAVMDQARQRAQQLLIRHKQTLIPLVQADLKSSDEHSLRRGLFITAQLALADCYDATLANLAKDDGKWENYAAYALARIGDQRAIKPLIERHTDQPMMYFEQIRSLQRKSKPHAAVIALLTHANPEARWRAAYTLAESGHASLVPHVRKLVVDTDSRVRRQAVHIGCSLEGKSFGQVRDPLISLLKDGNRQVRVAAAVRFAVRKDPICASALLKLIQDGTQPHWQHSNIVQAVHTLTGTYFGYYHGSDAWKPDTQNNQKAIKKFTAWVNAQTVKKR